MLSPKVHETIGSWSPDSLKLMKDLGLRVTEATWEKHAKSFLFQSMNLQRGNALCVSNENRSLPKKT